MEKPAESPGSRPQAPAPVKRAVSLLYVQAAIWVLLTAGIVADGSATLARTPSSKITTTVITVVLALAAGAFAAVKFRLAHRLRRGRYGGRIAVDAGGGQ